VQDIQLDYSASKEETKDQLTQSYQDAHVKISVTSVHAQQTNLTLVAIMQDKVKRSIEKFASAPGVGSIDDAEKLMVKGSPAKLVERLAILEHKTVFDTADGYALPSIPAWNQDVAPSHNSRRLDIVRQCFDLIKSKKAPVVSSPGAFQPRMYVYDKPAKKWVDSEDADLDYNPPSKFRRSDHFSHVCKTADGDTAADTAKPVSQQNSEP
jgi:hypothetical protein